MEEEIDQAFWRTYYLKQNKRLPALQHGHKLKFYDIIQLLTTADLLSIKFSLFCAAY